MLTAAGAHAGVLNGLPCRFGVTTGMGLMMVLVPCGLGRLVLKHPLVRTALQGSGAALLRWLAWKIAPSSRLESMPASHPVGAVGAAVLQWVNPTSWLVSASAAGTFRKAEAGSPVWPSACHGGLVFRAALPSGCLGLAFGATVPPVLQRTRRPSVFNIAMGALLAVSMALIVW